MSIASELDRTVSLVEALPDVVEVEPADGEVEAIEEVEPCYIPGHYLESLKVLAAIKAEEYDAMMDSNKADRELSIVREQMSELLIKLRSIESDQLSARLKFEDLAQLKAAAEMEYKAELLAEAEHQSAVRRRMAASGFAKLGQANVYIRPKVDSKPAEKPDITELPVSPALRLVS